ncbi:GerAB/ArcD/ProY family transporter [Crassaminicella profunda]|uniref:GerAB/ArcD/ProY family transporter n=1 Tax=Crassaminicella profunda TaxID=1286698 RepID=UPI001CA69FB8|nr:endospore germination permease [Crassaminicella profunda]QZY57312.1 endospore germination permease [Crassaminicella profunda]
MNHEIISEKQAIGLIALFVVAETFVLARGIEAKQDFWLAIILGMIISVPFMLIFSRLHRLYPQKDLFDMNECILGKTLGKILNFLLIYYVATNMMSVMSVFNHFIITVSLLDTPIEITYIALILLCIYGVRSGVEVMGRWTEFFLPIIIIGLSIGIVLVIPKMNVKNLYPILNEGIKPIVEGGILTFLFPLGETIAFVMIFTTLRDDMSFKRSYIYGLIFGGSLILILVLTEVLVIGVDQTSTYFFPGYQTFTRLSIGGTLERLEIISAATFILGGFIKISILLLAVSRGFAKIFNFDDYRFIVTPIGLFIANVSYIFYDSTMFMFEWIADFWGYFAFPFEFVTPIVLYIVAEVKMKLLNK